MFKFSLICVLGLLSGPLWAASADFCQPLFKDVGYRLVESPSQLRVIDLANENFDVFSQRYFEGGRNVLWISAHLKNDTQGTQASFNLTEALQVTLEYWQKSSPVDVVEFLHLKNDFRDNSFQEILSKVEVKIDKPLSDEANQALRTAISQTLEGHIMARLGFGVRKIEVEWQKTYGVNTLKSIKVFYEKI